MVMLPKLSATKRANYDYFAETMRELEFHLRGRIEESGLIPPEWEDIARRRGPMPKVRVSFWVEGDVAKFFKGMGTGYTTRMAEVLRAYRHARLAGLLRGAEGIDYEPLRGEERAYRLGLLTEAIRLNRERDEEEEAKRRR